MLASYLKAGNSYYLQVYGNAGYICPNALLTIYKNSHTTSSITNEKMSVSSVSSLENAEKNDEENWRANYCVREWLTDYNILFIRVITVSRHREEGRNATSRR